MDQSGFRRLELLEAGARKAERDLARQQQLIEDLRLAGYRTVEAEDFVQRFQTAYQALLTKLNVLRETERRLAG
jgi:hypothetical protein